MLKTISLLLISIILRPSGASSQNPERDSLLLLLPKTKEDTNKVNLLREVGIAIIYQNPPEAIPWFRQAITLAKKLNFNPGLERSYAATSTAYAFTGRYDSAVLYIDTAIQYAKLVGDVSRLALVYLNKADGLQNLSNYTAALKYCDTALIFAEQTGNKDRLARIYDIMSDVYRIQKQYPLALSHLDKALGLYKQLDNIQMVALVYYNKGNIYNNTNKEDSGIYYFKTAIFIADSIKDIQNLSAYHGELSRVYIKRKKYKEAEILLQKALSYARETGNAVQEATILSILYELYDAQNNLSKAMPYGLAAYNILKQGNDLSRQKGIATLLADAYFKTGNINEAYRFLKTSRELNDSLVKMQFNEETAKLQTTFQVAQKDKEIQLLGKDKEIQQQKLKQQRFLLITSAAIGLLAILGIGLLINRNRLRQQMKELELRNQIAADLHDEVGSSLSSIHMLSQIATQQPGSDTAQKDILTKMSSNAKETMDKMGDIVWMIKPVESEGSGLKQRMERFAYEICSSKNIDTAIELDEIEKIKLTMAQRKNLYLIFKEALNNAVKYSGSEKVEIKVQSANKQLQLLVKDYGKGFKPETTGRGNGLDNMKNRAKELNGHLEILSEPGQGTSVQLTIPV
jgi:two-component system, NarL family, sensor histidine kinase UhpB